MHPRIPSGFVLGTVATLVVGGGSMYGCRRCKVALVHHSSPQSTRSPPLTTPAPCAMQSQSYQSFDRPRASAHGVNLELQVQRGSVYRDNPAPHRDDGARLDDDDDDNAFGSDPATMPYRDDPALDRVGDGDDFVEGRAAEAVGDGHAIAMAEQEAEQDMFRIDLDGSGSDDGDGVALTGAH